MTYIVVDEIARDEEGRVALAFQTEADSMDDAREQIADFPDGEYQILKIMCKPIRVSRETKVVITGGETTSPRKRKE